MILAQAEGEYREARIVPVNDYTRVPEQRRKLDHGKGRQGRRVLKVTSFIRRTATIRMKMKYLDKDECRPERQFVNERDEQ